MLQAAVKTHIFRRLQAPEERRSPQPAACVFAGVSFQASLEMLQRAVSRAVLCLSCSLLLGLCLPAEGAGAAGPPPSSPPEQSGELDLEDWEWGSGSSFLHLLNSFPADSPFVTETPGKPVNCTQRFWLPPSSEICWENIAGPEEFAKSRLLVLQNRAALEALSTTSGMEEGGLSYEQQAKEELQGIHSDHLSMVETLETMEKVFVSLQEARREGKEQGPFTSIKEFLITTGHAIDGREHMASILENNFSNLENTLLNTQLRLSKLIRQ